MINIKQNYLGEYKYLKPFNCVQTNELGLVLERYLQTIRSQIIYIWYMHKQDLVPVV